MPEGQVPEGSERKGQVPEGQVSERPEQEGQVFERPEQEGQVPEGQVSERPEQEVPEPQWKEPWKAEALPRSPRREQQQVLKELK